MDVQKQAVDRVLEALSPGLAAELDRIVNETRQTLEAEFEKRLQQAVHDAEGAARELAASEIPRVIEETRDAVRKQVTDELQQQFAVTLADSNKNLRNKFDGEFSTAQTAWNSERDHLKEQLEQWRIFAEAQRQLIEAESQPEILMRWLKLAEPFGSSIAVYTAKADGLAFWKSRGKAVFPEIISQETTDPESYFKTVVVRGKTVAAVCAAKPFRPEALDFLVVTMERAIEMFGLKLRTPAARSA